MRVGVYDPKKVSLIVGTRKITGYAPGAFISAQYNNPARITPDVGAQGEYSLAVNPDRTGTITIILQPEAESNIYLGSLAASESIFPVLGQRLGTTVKEVITAPEAWIQESPGKDMDQGPVTRTWILGVGDLQLIDSEALT